MAGRRGICSKTGRGGPFLTSKTGPQGPQCHFASIAPIFSPNLPILDPCHPPKCLFRPLPTLVNLASKLILIFSFQNIQTDFDLVQNVSEEIY